MTKKQLVIVATIAAIAIFIVTIIRAAFYMPDNDVGVIPQNDADSTGIYPATSMTSGVPESELPARLIIPSLDINTDVQHVSINNKGNIANPSNFSDVGWYKHGIVPGHRGNSIVAGHVDNGLKLPGVFKHLDQLKPGDEITILTKKGERILFKVTGSEMYDYTADPSETIFAETNKARLNLITCDGDWLSERKTYTKRLVVFAERAS